MQAGFEMLGACAGHPSSMHVLCRSDLLDVIGFASRCHRHRYEVNPEYIDMIVKSGLTISGRSKDGLVEIIEDPNHPWFVPIR